MNVVSFVHFVKKLRKEIYMKINIEKSEKGYFASVDGKKVTPEVPKCEIHKEIDKFLSNPTPVKEAPKKEEAPVSEAAKK